MLAPDCSTKAVNRALIFQNKGYETRIVMGKGKFSPGHIHSQAKLDDGKWYWLYDSGKGAAALEKKPKPFTPSFYFGTQRYIDLDYFGED